MAMKSALISVKGVAPLLQNNPQTVDRFNKFAKQMAAINAKKTARTDEDYLELRDIEVRSKTYFDEKIGVYVPSSWVSEAIACKAFRIAKKSRDDVRGALFCDDEKLRLKYRGQDKVKTIDDIVGNDMFRHVMAVPQAQVRVTKAYPIFHDWSFEASIEFDDSVLDADSIERVIKYTARYGGFGDFRPRFGRADVEVIHG